MFICLFYAQKYAISYKIHALFLGVYVSDTDSGTTRGLWCG